MIFGTPPIITNGLVLHLDAGNRMSYPGTGSVTWSDLSRGPNSGSLFNAPTFNTNNQGNLVFNGTNQYVNLGSFTTLSSDRTFSNWFRVTAAITGRIVSFPVNETTTDQPNYILSFTNTQIGGAGLGGTPFDGYVTGTQLIKLNEWTNITSTISSNVITVYRNGSFFGRATNTGIAAPNPIGVIGRYNAANAQYMTGAVATMTIYNRVLSAQEIAQNYNALKSRFGLT